MPLIKTIDVNGQTNTVKDVLINMRQDDATLEFKVEEVIGYDDRIIEYPDSLVAADFIAANQGAKIMAAQNAIMEVIEATLQYKHGV